MTTNECFELGYIGKPLGLNGELFLYLEVDDAYAYDDLDVVFVEKKDGLVPYTIEDIDIHPKRIIVKFEDVDSVEKAEELKSLKLFLPLSFLPKLKEGQFYYHQLIGYEVFEATIGLIGKVETIYELPAQMLLAIQHKGREVLIPLQDNWLTYTHDQQRIDATLPDGYLDVYLD